ncbi:MAG: ribonuclease P protein component [Actinomycetes bacterium]
MRHHQSFSATVSAGRRASRRTLTVHVLPNADDTVTVPQVGFVVSKSVGGAVVRTRVRRRLRHIVRSRLEDMQAQAGRCAVVVRAGAASAEADSEALAADFEQAFSAALPTGPAR